jgi:chemotaxis protein methyltransferase CheR
MNTTLRIEIGDVEADELVAAIYDASGYDFSNYSTPSLHRRFQRFIDLKKISNFSGFIEQLHNDSVLLNEFIQEITVNVTEMFRDPYFFNIMKKEVLPQLKELPSIKIWHAGCSTGEEPYSMAIVLKEAGILDKAIIYATDINQTVLQTAASGKYSMDLLKTYESNYKESELKGNFADYYDLVEGNLIIKEELRKKIIFSTHNLVTDSGFNKFDLIICRNVLIYFNKQLQDQILQTFYNSLNNHGFLALGSKETIMFSSIEKTMDTYNSQFRIWRKMA